VAGDQEVLVAVGEPGPELGVELVEAAAVGVGPGVVTLGPRRVGLGQGRLDELDAEFRTGLTDCDQHLLVTSHEAFGYLARRYRLEQVSISGLSPDAEPDPRHLAELADLVRTRGVTTIFTEELVSPKVAETLAREAGVKTAVLNTIEGVAQEGRQDYFSLMRENLAVLRTALGCR
jgi:zinc transport system substrate-binding protein